VIVGGGPAAGFIVIDSALDAVCAAESATCTVKFDTAAVVGVPLMVPVGASVNPAGNVPEISDHV
jgi:hypothetical protein